MMDEAALDGFRFLLKFPSNDRATEMTEMVVLAIARRQDDAVALARAQCPRPCTTLVLASGPSVLEEAQTRGLDEGEAMTLQQSPSAGA